MQRILPPATIFGPLDSGKATHGEITYNIIDISIGFVVFGSSKDSATDS